MVSGVDTQNHFAYNRFNENTHYIPNLSGAKWQMIEKKIKCINKYEKIHKSFF